MNEQEDQKAWTEEGKRDWEEMQQLWKKINKELQQAYTNCINWLLNSEQDKLRAIKCFYHYIKNWPHQELTGES